MQPIKFEQANKHLDFPNGESLDFFQDELTGKVIMLWQFTPEEMEKFIATGQLYISQVLGNTAVPMLEVPFRDYTDEEKQQVDEIKKRIKVLQDREERSRKPNAKRVALKSLK